jgi:hypothetical protein
MDFSRADQPGSSSVGNIRKSPISRHATRSVTRNQQSSRNKQAKQRYDLLICCVFPLPTKGTIA